MDAGMNECCASVMLGPAHFSLMWGFIQTVKHFGCFKKSYTNIVIVIINKNFNQVYCVNNFRVAGGWLWPGSGRFHHNLLKSFGPGAPHGTEASHSGWDKQ